MSLIQPHPNTFRTLPRRLLVDGVADGYEAFALLGRCRSPSRRRAGAVRRARRPAAAGDRGSARLCRARHCRCSNCRPGTACPMTASRPAPTPPPSGWRRMSALHALAKKPHRAVVLTTANALLQRVPPADVVDGADLHGAARQPDRHERAGRAGWKRPASSASPTVRDVGEFAVRGGILDLFAPGAGRGAAARFLRRHAGDRSAPSIRPRQRTTGQRKSLDAARR